MSSIKSSEKHPISFNIGTMSKSPHTSQCLYHNRTWSSTTFKKNRFHSSGLSGLKNFAVVQRCYTIKTKGRRRLLGIKARVWNAKQSQNTIKAKSLRARWPVEPVLISGFCSVILLLLDGTLIHRRLAPSRRWYSFTYPGRMESWVSLGGKDTQTSIQLSAEPGSNWGPCGRKAEILLNAPTMPAQNAIVKS